MGQRRAADDHVAIFARLTRGDPTASSDLAVATLDPLIAWLARAYPAIPDDMRATAAEDAILTLIKRPETYDPTKSPLMAYLRRSAKGDLLNLWQKEQRHRMRREDIEAVALSPRAGNRLQDADSDPARVYDAIEAVRARIPAPTAGLTEREAAVQQLMDGGERRTEAYAAVLGIGDLPMGEQRRIVKQAKDRLTKRRHRAGKRGDA